MPPKPKFTDGERVLCFHGNLLYEAKCVKSEAKEKAMRYFIHYNGWNKNWDEWVPESRVLKYNEQSLQKQKELQRANAGVRAPKGAGAGRGQVGRPKRVDKEKAVAAADKEKPERASTPTVDSRAERAEKRKGAKADSVSGTSERLAERESRASTPTVDSGSKERGEKRKTSTSTPIAAPAAAPATPPSEPPASNTNTGGEPKKKRSRMDITVEMEDAYASKIEVRIKIPDELKPWLVDDWDLINRQKQLVSLPCKTTVDTILEDFVKFKLAKGSNPQKDAMIEMTQGVRDYFNVMLGSQLLYKFERVQYSEVLADHPDVPMCKIYGATHLLRLFVKLGSMLAYTPLDEKSIHLLLLHLHDLLRYLAKNTSSLFSVTDYIVAPPEYHRKAM